MSSDKKFEKNDFKKCDNRNYAAENRTYSENPYDDNIALKRDIAKFLNTPNDKYYDRIQDIIDNDDDTTHIVFKF